MSQLEFFFVLSPLGDVYTMEGGSWRGCDWSGQAGGGHPSLMNRTSVARCSPISSWPYRQQPYAPGLKLHTEAIISSSNKRGYMRRGRESKFTRGINAGLISSQRHILIYSEENHQEGLSLLCSDVGGKRDACLGRSPGQNVPRPMARVGRLGYYATQAHVLPPPPIPSHAAELVAPCSLAGSGN